MKQMVDKRDLVPLPCMLQHYKIYLNMQDKQICCIMSSVFAMYAEHAVNDATFVFHHSEFLTCEI